jgi:cell division protein FtsI (penicillin-binding protein 3)
MVKPCFVESIRYYGRTIREFYPELIDPSICSKQTLSKMKRMLEGVVENGTAQNLSNENFRIAGKTGTAQIANEKYGYKVDSKVSYQASFAGYFPAENPKYSCIVVVNSPTSDVYYGNLVAGPVFREIANKIYATRIELQESLNMAQDTSGVDVIPYSKNGSRKELETVLHALGVPVRTARLAKDAGINESQAQHPDWVITEKQEDHILLNRLNIYENLVPNVKEMGGKDAVYLLENAGLKVMIRGRGKVRQQSIPPGTRIVKGQTIILTMSFT